MTNQAKSDFVICQRDARKEFLNSCQIRNAEQLLELIAKQDVFLDWLNENKTLTKLGYATRDPNARELNIAYKVAVKDYEKAIMYWTGVKLWNDHRHAFRTHKKYFGNHLMKPFSMLIVDFNNCMKQYGELLCHLPPPSSKKCNKLADGKWDTLQVSKEEIRYAIFDALPQDYQTHIQHCFEADWQDMNENEFLNAMSNYKFIDNTRRFRHSQREKKRKEAASKKRQTPPNTDADNQQKNKRPYARTSMGGKQSNPRNRKFCQYCKDNNGKWWTHNTTKCYLKKPEKEVNAIETVQKELDKVKNLIKNLRKRSHNNSDSE